jgi:acetyltransferase-like isoleucine patch superfamily enzyme
MAYRHWPHEPGDNYLDTRRDATSVLYKTTRILNNSHDPLAIYIGAHTHIRGELMTFGHGGKISIGDYCYVGDNSYIWSALNIRIGNRVLISHNVNIFDSLTHPLSATTRHEHFKSIIAYGHPKLLDLAERPIVIEDDVWIGCMSIILQGAQRDDNYNGAVLVALNSSWDSAALGLHTVYDSMQQWVTETVRYILENSSVSVVVRQHPVERMAIARSSDDYPALLKQHFADNSRLYFIAANDPINTYDLLEKVCAVVVYTSTIGIEAAVQGKPVISESASYYANLGFIFNAHNENEYFRLLSSAVAGQLKVTSAMRDDALTCYYISQCCNRFPTYFNAVDFPVWSRGTIDDLAREPSVSAILEAVETNMPIAFISHQQQFSASGWAARIHESENTGSWKK